MAVSRQFNIRQEVKALRQLVQNVVQQVEPFHRGAAQVAVIDAQAPGVQIIPADPRPCKARYDLVLRQRLALPPVQNQAVISALAQFSFRRHKHGIGGIVLIAPRLHQAAVLRIKGIALHALRFRQKREGELSVFLRHERQRGIRSALGGKAAGAFLPQQDIRIPAAGKAVERQSFRVFGIDPQKDQTIPIGINAVDDAAGLLRQKGRPAVQKRPVQGKNAQKHPVSAPARRGA